MEASLVTAVEGPATRLAFTGGLDAAATARLWPEATRQAQDAGVLTLDLTGLTGLDTAGAVLLLRLERLARETRWHGPPPGPLQAVLDRTRQALAAPPAAAAPSLPALAQLGQATVRRGQDLLSQIGFLGEAVVAGLGTIRRPWRLRLAEVLRHLDEAGLRAFGLTLLLGVLIGVILAFQSSIPMRRFGAQSFIPNLVGISLLRELGPLMAAVILAGRTGSAFAAELGTMTVNEEIDALRIMGIDPVAWLVLPRLLAAILVMPILALLMDLAGLIGMGLVMGSLGFPPVGVVNQLRSAIGLKDLMGGLFKAAVFGLSIGLVGCRAGLSAGRGPRAVGDAATAAVVGGIVSIVVLDGIFSILFFRLGW
ncbi:ABC transporter permease [Belnapia rosea]|uniref:Phospholipid/cholesterol/gamma-HCH transport system permease protein n=1 Tax=Belnapia rosea TaxID=938405 RepID=A0A1G6T1P7_9PROT|nr:ABC transporter permease [Belnapia rosea]SDD23100.1 phospholipid/cholesterol/gamma-HCH transport system permease protein [Belnapia rosea]